MKVREVSIRKGKEKFNIFLNKKTKNQHDFENLKQFRRILSKEKVKVLDTIKYQKPSSIYELAKILERPFKAVNDDVKLLEKFGILKLVKEKTKKRIRLKPQILTDHIVIHLKI